MEVRKIINDYNDYIKGFTDSSNCTEFFYRNGIHLLFIREVSKNFQLCGLGTGFHPIVHYNNFDVYFVSPDKTTVIEQFQRFVNLLISFKKSEYKTLTQLEDYNNELEF